MKSRIDDKINDINEFLKTLEEFKPESLEKYKTNLLKRSACERIIEKVIEASVDLAFITLKHLKIEVPADASDTGVFDIMFNLTIITKTLSENMKNAKMMRNIIVHEYGKIDDDIVYNSIDELKRDINEFIESIDKYLNEKEKQGI